MIEEVAGLKVRTVKKLTTGPRAVLSLSEREFNRLRFDSQARTAPYFHSVFEQSSG